MSVTRPAFTHPISYENRTVVLVTPYYPGCTVKVGRTGETARNIAQWLRNERGIRSQVIIPNSETLPAFGWESTNHFAGYTVKHSRFDGIPVFSIDATDESGNEYNQTVAFGRALSRMISVNDFYNFPPSLFHFLDSKLGVAIGPVARRLTGKTVFFSPLEQDHVFSPAFSSSINGLDHGARNADAVVLWSEQFNKSMAEASDILRQNLRHPDEKIATLEGDWNVLEGPIPQQTLSSLEKFYLERLYGGGLSRSINFTKNPGLKMTNVAYLVPEPEDESKPSRTNAILTAIGKHRAELDQVASRINVGGTGRNGVENDYYGNSGSLINLIRMLGKMKADGRYLIIPDCGYFERGGALTNSTLVEGLKGLSPEGRYSLGVNCIRQAPAFFRQLPGHGEGWVVWTASDNVWIPNDSPMVGNKYMWEATQGIILTGPETAAVDLSSFGWWLTKDDGNIFVFAEKTPDTVAASIVSENGRTSVLKNTFVFAMKVPVAARLEELLSEPSNKDGKALFSTYPIDISSNIFCPMTLKENEWEEIYASLQKLRQGGSPVRNKTENGLDTLEVAKGMLKLEKDSPKFDNFIDWMRMWAIAQELKDLANGLGGANIGKTTGIAKPGNNCIWDDCGSLKAIHRLWTMYLDSDPYIREIYRSRAGFPINSNLQNVTGLNYVTFVDPKTGQPMNKGDVPENVLLVNVTFEGPITISADGVTIVDSKLGKGVKHISSGTIIADSDIDTMEDGIQPAETAADPKFIFGVREPKLVAYGGFFHTSLSLKFANPGALDTLGLNTECTPIALVPIEMNLKEPLSKDPGFETLKAHPALSLLCDTKPIADQSFVVQDPATGKPKLLGMNFLGVRGGY